MSRLIERIDEHPMARLGDAMKPIRDPTPDERQAIENVRAMAAELATLDARRHPAFRAEIRKLTTSRERNTAIRFTEPTHADFPALMAMLDGLIADQEMLETKHGAFTKGDLHEAGARIIREDGREIIQFPIRWPWRIPPDDKRGIPGVRGEPVYRTKEERAPKVESFRAVRRADVRPPDEDWGD